MAEMPEEAKFSDDIQIHRENLDEDNIVQGSHVYKWGRKNAEAEAEMGKAESRLKVLKATKAGEIRKNPSAFGITGKPTVEEVKDALERDVEVQKSTGELIEAKKNFGIISAAYEAIVQKGYSLNNMVRLFENDYFSVTKQVDNSINRTMHRREEGGHNDGRA